MQCLLAVTPVAFSEISHLYLHGLQHGGLYLVTQKDSQDSSTVTSGTTLLLTGAALLFNTLLQKTTQGLTSYHAIIALYLCYLTTIYAWMAMVGK